MLKKLHAVSIRERKKCVVGIGETIHSPVKAACKDDAIGLQRTHLIMAYIVMASLGLRGTRLVMACIVMASLGLRGTRLVVAYILMASLGLRGTRLA